MATNAPAAHTACMLVALLNKGLEQAFTQGLHGYIKARWCRSAHAIHDGELHARARAHLAIRPLLHVSNSSARTGCRLRSLARQVALPSATDATTNSPAIPATNLPARATREAGLTMDANASPHTRRPLDPLRDLRKHEHVLVHKQD